MEKEIRNFIYKFGKIRNLGYVKAINNDSSGIGLTFEKLLGKEIDNFPYPDFQNVIEIKTKLAYSNKPIHLFKLSPNCNDFFDSKKILEKYGHYNPGKRATKSFNCTIFANKITKSGLFYYFSIGIDYKEQKILLLVYNDNYRLIDNSIFWTFENVENAVLRKLKCLAFVQVWATHKNGINYYKYYRYDIYKYSNFYNFLNLIEKGIISITFSMDIYNSEKRQGQVHDHGVSFDIDKSNLNKLFFQIY